MYYNHINAAKKNILIVEQIIFPAQRKKKRNNSAVKSYLLYDKYKLSKVNHHLFSRSFTFHHSLFLKYLCINLPVISFVCKGGRIVHQLAKLFRNIHCPVLNIIIIDQHFKFIYEAWFLNQPVNRDFLQGDIM